MEEDQIDFAEDIFEQKGPKRNSKPVWVNLKQTKYPIVKTVCRSLGYRPTKSDSKGMLIWTDSGGTTDVASYLEPWQFYNHFSATWQIAHKIDLAKNYQRMESLLPDIYNFHPKTFILPYQINDLKTYMQSTKKKINVYYKT